MTDPREQPLNDVTRKIMVQSNYDPHFSAIEERIIMETKLFLARYDALCTHFGWRTAEIMPRQGDDKRSVPRTPDPIPMILFCPSCGVQHIDAEEPHRLDCVSQVGGIAPEPCDCGRWTNPSHLSHLCHGCGHVWRPADVPTTGVAEITTRGGRDTPEPIRGNVLTPHFMPAPAWRHKKWEGIFTEIGRGRLEVSQAYNHPVTRNTRLVAYRGPDSMVWFRPETEFDDGRFEKA